MKKFLSLVLALVMALSLTTIAWGATTVTDEAGLVAAVATGGDIELGANIVLTGNLTIASGVTATIDLMGYTISQEKACTAHYEMITVKGTLTIKDSVGGGKISFKDTGAGDPSFGWGSYTVRNNGGTLVVDGGTIEHLGEQNPGNGQPNVHMYCAIDQYTGSTTINDGTISTPTYRSARLWMGDMTINGGTFIGQLWVQNMQNGTKLTINGGTFTPAGNDSSAVYIGNGSQTVDLTITDGTFNGKVGCADASALADSVTGGTFAVAPDAALLADGLRYDSATGEVTTMPTTGVGKYDLYDANGDLYKENITVEYVEAYDDEGAGNIEYYKLTYDGVTYTYFVECSRTKAECYLTLADNLGAYKHLKHVDYVDYVATGKTYTNIGDDCGELDVSAKAKAYVVTDEDGVKTYFVASASGQKVIKVGNELVAVNEVVGGLVPHVWVVTAYNDKEEPATVKCKNCPATGKLYATKLAAPIGATFDDTQVAGYWVVVNGSAAPSTDKVQSAETFDAGIAMYVGMSVLAATGSAVVIGKKKD